MMPTIELMFQMIKKSMKQSKYFLFDSIMKTSHNDTLALLLPLLLQVM